MINVIVFLFIFLSFLSEYLFDLSEMMTYNLPIVIISRVIFIYAFYLNYIKYTERDSSNKRILSFSKKELLYFGARNAMVVLIGFLNIYIALFLGIYSLLYAGYYFKNIGVRKKSSNYLRIGIAFYGILPFVSLGLFFVLVDFYATIPILAAMVYFFYRGQKRANLSLKQLFEQYDRRILNRTPLIVQIAVIVFLVGGPIFMLVGLQIWMLDFFVWWSLFFEYLFNFPLMLALNLTIVVTARAFLIAAMYYNHQQSNLKNTEQKHPFFLSRKQKSRFILINTAIIFFGFLVVYVAIFFAIYSLLIAATYFQTLKRERQQSQKKFKLLRFVSYILAITSTILVFVLYFNEYVYYLLIISAVLPLLLFLIAGKKSGKIDLIIAFKSLNNIIRKKQPKFLKYFLMVYLIVIPITIILGLFIYGPIGPRKDTVMIEMSDGTELATDIYYSPLAWDYIKGEPKPAPVILVRTPYGKSDMAIIYTSLYCSQGYHVVIQDFRGCFDSEGGDDFLIFTKDFLDGPDTIEWILDQDWCNGKMGSAGVSALCITQYMYAGMNPDGLLCQSLWFGTPDLVQDAILEGAFHEALVIYWLKGVAPNNWRKQLDIIYDYMSNVSKINDLEVRSVTLDYPPNTYGNVTVHGIHVGGWYDHFLKGTIHGYTGYDDKGDKEARGHQKLIIGPWIHAMVFLQQQGELSYPSNANGLPLIMKWETEIFDESLLGADKDIWSGDRVAYYLMGDVDDSNADANYWKYAEDWPLDYDWNKWYLGENKEGDLVVVDDASDLHGFHNISYLYDPSDPVMTRGGNNEPSFTAKGAGPFDQRPVDEPTGKLRDDILLFQSEEFEEPYTIEGDLNVTLFIKSDCNDTCFVVKLCDVYPDGRRMLIIDSAMTTRYRVNNTSENFIEPEKEYCIAIDLAATAYQFNKGHRIAVEVTSSNYDRFAINPNTGGPITDHYSEGKIANNTIITGPGKSCVSFPELRK